MSRRNYGYIFTFTRYRCFSEFTVLNPPFVRNPGFTLLVVSNLFCKYCRCLINYVRDCRCKICVVRFVTSLCENKWLVYFFIVLLSPFAFIVFTDKLLMIFKHPCINMIIDKHIWYVLVVACAKWEISLWKIFFLDI